MNLPAISPGREGPLPCRFPAGVLILAAAILAFARPAGAVTNVAVFNFQMTSATPEWEWLAKGLGERLATDLFQLESLCLVERDRMQQLSEQLRWQPEMMLDVKALDSIRNAARIEYIVSGVYEVAGDKLTIAAQIVDVVRRNEVARRSVSGKPQEALTLIRQLSAEVASVLDRRPAAEMLKALPVWTRSLPASRALYEGVDLYDQGRFGEAWLRFRQAAREDPGYVEAQYWVGKMYYFMGRHEHAWRAFERFVYMDEVHPRVGDAIREYIDTFEKRGASPEQMIDLYVELRGRYPEAMIHDHVAITGMIRNDKWLRLRTAAALSHQGNYARAAHVADASEWGGTSSWIANYNLRVHNALTGRSWTPEWLLNWDVRGDALLQFDKDGQAALDVQAPHAEGWFTHAHGKQDVLFSPKPFGTGKEYFLVAPDQRPLKSVRLYVEPKGQAQGTIEVSIGKDHDGDVGQWRCSVAQAQKDGLLVDNLPPAGLFYMLMSVQGGSLARLRATAQFQPVEGHGAIDVTCENATNIRVEIDGRFARTFAGVAGSLKPGPHTVVVRPTDPSSPYDSWSGQVTVRPDQCERLRMTLPWRPTGPWAKWSFSQGVAHTYSVPMLTPRDRTGVPSLQVDGEAIRMVWARDGDLWWSISLDGRTFTSPRRLPMPVSGGWWEDSPDLQRGEDGRFLLTFRSDRNGRHVTLPYVTWSRDMEHWSDPVAVSMADNRLSSNICRNRDGQFVMALWVHESKGFDVFTSRDAYLWTRSTSVHPKSKHNPSLVLQLAQAADGTLELYWDSAPKAVDFGHTTGQISRLLIDPDGNAHDEVVVGTLPMPDHPYVSVLHPADGRTVLLCSGAQTWSNEHSRAFYWWDDQQVMGLRADGYYLTRPKGAAVEAVVSTWAVPECSNQYDLLIWREESPGQWQAVPHTTGLAQGFAAMAYHPRWGFLIGSMAPVSGWIFPRPAFGPMLMTGPALPGPS